MILTREIPNKVISLILLQGFAAREYKNLFNKDKILEWNTDIELKRQKAGTIKNHIEATLIFYLEVKLGAIHKVRTL